MTGLIKRPPGRPPKPHKPRTDWSDRDKLRAATVYKSLGNQAKTCEVTGIPPRTLAFWMQQEWWKEKMHQLRAEDTAELTEAATNIAKQSQEVVKERLTNGDFILNRDGELIRKPVSARDAAIIGAVAIDKRKILQEEPVREQELGTSERLLKLVEQFARFTSAKEIKGMLKTVDTAEKKEEEIPEEEIEAEYVEETGPASIFTEPPQIQVNEKVENAE